MNFTISEWVSFIGKVFDLSPHVADSRLTRMQAFPFRSSLLSLVFCSLLELDFHHDGLLTTIVGDFEVSYAQKNIS